MRRLVASSSKIGGRKCEVRTQVLIKKGETGRSESKAIYGENGKGAWCFSHNYQADGVGKTLDCDQGVTKILTTAQREKRQERGKAILKFLKSQSRGKVLLFLMKKLRC